MTIPLETIDAGTEIDHYRVVELVSHGKIYAVFRAIDTRTQKQVALKIPTPLVENDALLYDRMRREVEIGERLNHPAILKVIGQQHRADKYLALEWCDGLPLRTLLQQGKLGQARSIVIMTQLLDALEYIHLNGIHHRDLRPDNILVDGQDNIKLIDFGIAGSVAARRITYTNISSSLNAPYISPEQVQGKRGDARSDIYSAGVILYEMLTGKLPFSGANPLEMMNNRLIKPPVPPASADPSISPQLQEVLYRALEREPHRRYYSAREFQFDLEHLELVGLSERKEELAWRGGPPPQLKRFLYFALFVLLPIFILALAYFLMGPR